MDHSSSLVFAGIAPHPPIMVPEVGRDAIAEVRSSIDAMAELTRRLIAAKAETVVIISPHAPLERDAFIAYDGPQLHGDFANFRAPTATVNFDLDDELLNEITRAAANEQLMVMRIRGYDLDHGTAVPLYFLQRHGWHGKVIALGYNFLSNEDHVRFGKCIREAIERSRRRAAFIASGDLSHRLKADAPAGYYPEAYRFDREVVDAIDSCATERIVNIDQNLRRAAGECGYRSMLVAIGAVPEDKPSCEVISYEAPFGVGYLVAQLVNVAPASESRAVATGSSDSLAARDESESTDRDPLGQLITGLARKTIETFVDSGRIIDAPGNLVDFFNARAGCFVSIKTRDGDLRGCVGTVEPVKTRLAEEIIYNAISAATRDPRFAPVQPDELPNLKYSVDVLSEPEPCRFSDLDPENYGVIVEHQSGFPRGLLLPNLRGVDSAREQVEIAASKAGLDPLSNLKFFRFRADRYSE
ncbi:MAG TPA: AmmeMemoRadiSam system protein A [Pyrinomonadaceae bacterium]|nr:AmmeMemoRadiSam system protein A [Pyrinomonadaceae bacterium]